MQVRRVLSITQQQPLLKQYPIKTSPGEPWRPPRRRLKKHTTMELKQTEIDFPPISQELREDASGHERAQQGACDAASIASALRAPSTPVEKKGSPKQSKEINSIYAWEEYKEAYQTSLRMTATELHAITEKKYPACLWPPGCRPRRSGGAAASACEAGIAQRHRQRHNLKTSPSNQKGGDWERSDQSQKH